MVAPAGTLPVRLQVPGGVRVELDAKLHSSPPNDGLAKQQAAPEIANRIITMIIEATVLQVEVTVPVWSFSFVDAPNAGTVWMQARSRNRNRFILTLRQTTPAKRVA
jgi:hypothetical protein